MGLISGLILLGQGDKPFFFRKICSFFCTFFWTNNCIPRFLATSIVNLPNKTWVQNNLENSSHNSEPSHQSGCNINCFKTGGLYKAGLQWGTAPILKSSMLLDPRFQPCLRAVRTGCVRSVFLTIRSRAGQSVAHLSALAHKNIEWYFYLHAHTHL